MGLCDRLGGRRRGWCGNQDPHRSAIPLQIATGDALDVLRGHLPDAFKEPIDLFPPGADALSLAQEHRLPEDRVLAEDIRRLHLILGALDFALARRLGPDERDFMVQGSFDARNLCARRENRVGIEQIRVSLEKLTLARTERPR